MNTTSKELAVDIDFTKAIPDEDSGPILSWDHWPVEWKSFDLKDYRHGCLYGDDAHAWLAMALDSGFPKSICSLSDADVALWAYHELRALPEVDVRWLDTLIHTTGVSGGHDDLLWPLLDAAYQQTSTWLIQSTWDIAARLSYRCMALKGVGIHQENFVYHGRPKQKVDCESVYSFAEKGLLLQALSGRRLAVLSGVHESLTEALQKSGMTVSVSCPFPRSVHQRKLAAVSAIIETLFQQDWDLLLCSAGGYSPIFCHYAAQHGRQGFDIGSVDGILATGQRQHAQFF